MAYDADAAALVRRRLAARNDVREIKMFGGLCFMVGGHMCCGVLKDDVIFRVAPKRCDETIAQGRARPMDFTGKIMKGFAMVGRDGWGDARTLGQWLKWALEFNAALPAKKPKKRRGPMPRPYRRLRKTSSTPGSP